jgi:hypothetical protein
MGNDKLKIISCKIPRLSRQIAVRRVQRLADYPLARASEWAPLPASQAELAADGEEADDLQK